jgi:hypothetical protein
VEPNQVDVLAFTVLRDFEQIDDTQETRLARQSWSDVQKADRLDGIHFDLTFIHTVPGACFDVRASPDSDAASDFSATNSIAKTLREDHDEKFTSKPTPLVRSSRRRDRVALDNMDQRHGKVREPLGKESG